MFSRLSVYLAPMLLCAAAPALAAGFDDCPQFFAGKPPSTIAYGQLRELCLDEYAVLHSGQSKTPILVAQRLNARMLNLAKDLKRKDKFREDARLPEGERAKLSDYRNSGFSRGHMAAAGDMSTEQGKAQSYLLSNMVPQDIRQNGKAWSQIEQDTRSYIRRAKGDVFVITGPVFSPDLRTVGDGNDDRPERRTIGESRVWVPDAVFKMVYDPATGQRWVHLQDNQPSAKPGKPLSYEEFVQRTGIRLLD